MLSLLHSNIQLATWFVQQTECIISHYWNIIMRLIQWTWTWASYRWIKWLSSKYSQPLAMSNAKLTRSVCVRNGATSYEIKYTYIYDEFTHVYTSILICQYRLKRTVSTQNLFHSQVPMEFSSSRFTSFEPIKISDGSISRFWNRYHFDIFVCGISALPLYRRYRDFSAQSINVKIIFTAESNFTGLNFTLPAGRPSSLRRWLSLAPPAPYLPSHGVTTFENLPAFMLSIDLLPTVFHATEKNLSLALAWMNWRSLNLVLAISP